MNKQNLIIAAELLLTFSSFVCCILCFRLTKMWKTKANDYLVVVEQFEHEVKVLSCNLEASVEREGVYLNKLSKLNNKTESKFNPQTPVYNTKSNMTEKRHRILALAKSGQDVDTIAGTLGLPYGEVELIVNLNIG